MVRLHVIEQALVMGDQQHRLVGRAHDRIDALTHHLQRVDVESAVCLVQHGEFGVENAHLHHLVALLLAAGKADIHVALHHVHVELQQAGLFLRQLEEFAARERFLAARLALRIERFAQELHI